MATTTRAQTKSTNGTNKAPLFSRAIRPAKPRLMRWTYEQYQKMTALGWFDRRRVELIGGEIIEMAAMHEPHWVSGGLTETQMRAAFDKQYIIVVQKPLHLPNESAPEPDVAVVRGTWRDYSEGLPTSAVLVVEIAVATLRIDRITKSSLYAATGIEDYWIVNVKARKVEVHRTPVENVKAKFGWSYQDKTEYKEDKTISPLAAPQAKIKVADLLP